MGGSGANARWRIAAAGLVDELIVYIAPKRLGSDARGLCTLPGLQKLATPPI
ncbi:dihydrofolate reductase family protein [Shigella flexneri]